MTEQTPPLTRHDLEARIVKRCWEDGALRKEFTADPAGTFVKYLEIPATSLPKIVVHQEMPGTWHIALPSRPVRVDEFPNQRPRKSRWRQRVSLRPPDDGASPGRWDVVPLAFLQAYRLR
jgi:hypothetical protein